MFILIRGPGLQLRPQFEQAEEERDLGSSGVYRRRRLLMGKMIR